MKMEGYIMGEGRGGLRFHKVASHHQEKEISEIKNEISSTHGQNPCRLPTSSVLPLTSLIGSRMIVSAISAFSKHQPLHEAMGRQTPHADNTHTRTQHFDAFYLHYTDSKTGETRALHRLVCSNF